MLTNAFISYIIFDTHFPKTAPPPLTDSFTHAVSLVMPCLYPAVLHWTANMSQHHYESRS